MCTVDGNVCIQGSNIMKHVKAWKAHQLCRYLAHGTAGKTFPYFLKDFKVYLIFYGYCMIFIKKTLFLSYGLQNEICWCILH